MIEKSCKASKSEATSDCDLQPPLFVYGEYEIPLAPAPNDDDEVEVEEDADETAAEVSLTADEMVVVTAPESFSWVVASTCSV